MLSLIFWTLVTVVTSKYQIYVIRFDNQQIPGIAVIPSEARNLQNVP